MRWSIAPANPEAARVFQLRIVEVEKVNVGFSDFGPAAAISLVRNWLLIPRTIWYMYPKLFSILRGFHETFID